LKYYITQNHVRTVAMLSTAVRLSKEICEHRHLLWSMVARNLKGKYTSSYLGVAWHFITPVISIILFYIVFTGIMERSIDNYWLYLCVGMFPFTFFQENLTSGAGCVVSNSSAIKKMYFPREIVVLSQILSTFITFMIAYLAVIILSLFSGTSMGANTIIFLPLVLLLSLTFATGYVLLLSAVTVFVRDIQHLIQALARILFWVTPIFYMVTDLKGVLAELIWYNPLAHFIDLYHDMLYFGIAPSTTQLCICLLFAGVMFTTGAIVFNKLKWKFAEEL